MDDLDYGDFDDLMDFADLNLNFMTEDVVMNAVHNYVAATPMARAFRCE